MAETKRRSPGDGCITQRKDGRWSSYITLEGGKRKTFYGKTKKEVKEKLKEAQFAQMKGLLVAAPQQTVGQFLMSWLEDTHKFHLRIRTYERYHQYLRLHLIPGLGHIQLQKLSPQDLQAFYKLKMEEGGLSGTTVGTMHNILHKALDTAVRWDLVARNVCERVTPPRKEHYEIQPLTKDQVQQFIRATCGNYYENLFLLALGTGMRQGEVIALKWQDVNLEVGTLQVRRVLSHVDQRLRKDGAPAYIEAEPKTESSRRTIVLPKFVVDSLLAHRAEQQDIKLVAGDTWVDQNYVFCTAKGRHLHPNPIVVAFKKVLKRAGLPDIRFHDLRHTAATMLLELGVHPKIVQERMGHSEISMTMDIYSHVMPTMQRQAIMQLDDAFLD
jgi:integrase